MNVWSMVANFCHECLVDEWPISIHVEICCPHEHLSKPVIKFTVQCSDRRNQNQRSCAGFSMWSLYGDYILIWICTIVVQDQVECSYISPPINNKFFFHFIILSIIMLNILFLYYTTILI